MKHFFRSVENIPVFSLLLIIILTSGCKENALQTNSSAISTRDELTDPNVKPEVIWTFPTNNSVGPFTTFNENSHYFTVQFNKLMNLYTFTSNTVKIKGFNTKVILSFYDGGYSPQQFQNVIKFYVRNYSNGSLMSFEVGKTYTVEIDSTVEDIHGKRLKSKYSFSFTPEPALRVRFVDPSDGDTAIFNYDYQNYISVGFNSILNTASLSSLHISPALSGIWNLDQYGNLSIARFTPTNGYNFSTQYQIIVDQNMTDKYGNVLAQPFVSTFITSAFKIVSTYPQDLEENVPMYSGNSISITLSGPVDPATLSSAFTISPFIQGNISSNGSQINFYTNDQLTPGTKYTVTLGTTLKAKNGTPLSSSYTFSFTTEDFRVYNVEPYQGSSNVSLTSQIRFSFNAPIDQASAVSAFTIEPAVTGNFSFLYYDNRTFTFIPTQPLKMGTQYTVTLATSMKSINGAALKEPYKLQFTTTPFQVSTTNPSNNSYNVTPSNISIWFTAEFDTGTIRNSFTISPAIAGNFSFYSNQLIFTPSKPFASGKTYTITLSTGVKAKDGTSLQSPYILTFTTQPFQITNISPSNGSTGNSRTSSIYVYTNLTIDQTSTSAAFSISPTVAGNLYTNGSMFYFSPQTQFTANTNYTVTISTKLKSTNGDTLKTAVASPFTTGP